MQPRHHQHHHFPSHGHSRRPLHSIMLKPGQVVFRVVCHFSIIGGLIGPHGSVISQIRRDTGCTIHCEELVQGSDHRVILVVGPVSPGKRILLEEGDEVELVSVAQEAVVRVCERMWEVDGQKEKGRGEGGLSEGYCGLLADTSQIGAVLGRAGKNVVRMRRESGAQIRVLPAPHCAAQGDELIQITGTILAVKKALVTVTECLHDCPPYPSDRDPMPFTRPVEASSHMDSSDPHAEFFPHLSSFLPPYTRNSANSHSSCSDADKDPDQDVKASKKEVSFRLLCSNGAAGSIIGKKGTIVRTLQNETGASIMFAAPTTISGDRVVTISALENTESWYSPAQNAVVLVFARSVEHDIEKGHTSVSIKGTAVTARLLVESNIICCLSGSGGVIDSEMTKVTGADVRILEGEQILDCASKNDVVIEAFGATCEANLTEMVILSADHCEVLNEVRTRSPHGRVMEIPSPRVQQRAGLSCDSVPETSLTRRMDQLGLSSSLDDTSSSGLQSPQVKLGKGHTSATKENEKSSTIFSTVSELERSMQFLLPKEVLNEVGVKSPGGVRENTFPESDSPLGLYSDPIQESILTKENNQPGLSINMDAPSPALHMPKTAGRGSTTFGGAVELDSLCSKKRSTIVRNVIVELVVSEDILGSIYGEDGSNLTQLRQISGAKVEVRDPSPGKSERTVVISGKPDQTRSAQSLLQAFISADE